VFHAKEQRLALEKHKGAQNDFVQMESVLTIVIPTQEGSVSTKTVESGVYSQ